MNRPPPPRFRSHPRAALLALAGALPIALATVPGCSSSANVESRSTTVGQELQDLEDARNKGLLTEEEYQKKRKEIMKR